MLRKLTVDQINDWFTIGKTVTNVELLGLPPAFPAEAAREEALRPDAAPGDAPVVQAQVPGPVVATAPARPASASGRSLSQRSSEMEYINKYRQLEAQELDMYGQDQPPSGPESNSVVIIHGATGSGKSTQLPQYILDHYAQRSAFCNIVVTQPRKIGASSIARWISKERSWTLGGLVGYQVGLEKIATEDTRLIYMTTGVLLQKIVSAKSLMEFTHVFIDEVHERTEEMDFLLLVVRKLLRTNSRFVKVILMSATINCKEFADYFAVPVQNKMNPAYVFEVEGKPHTIEEYYLNDLGHIYHSGLPPYRLEEPVITKDVYEVAVSLIQMFDDLDMKESGNKVHFSGSSKSDCLALVEAFRVAELYEELKNRISQFNMFVDPRHPVLDQEHPYKQRFILQVVLAGAFYPNYFTFGQPDEEMAVRELAGKDPKTTVVLKHIPPYGFLYYKQLQSLFRQCGQVKSIVFDGAKVNVDFQKQTVDPMQVSFNTLDRPRTVADLLLTVDVTEVVEVGHFWGYRIDERNAELLKKLTAEINRLELVPLPVHPHPDLVCLAPFTDYNKESYFRAQILYVSGNSAEVFFVDYGNRSHVDLDLLREIPCQLLELPFQALEFKICKMRPSAKSLICGEHWSGGANGRFASLVSGCPLLVKVFSVVHSVLHVDVYQYSGVQDAVNIRDVLIREGHAELAEESYESKQSYEALKGFFAKSVESVPDASMSSPMKDDEKHLIRILLESFASNRLGAPNCKAVLHGPFNPYELKCHSLTRISKFRCVWIEKESINSVVISDSPADLHQRMLVAASLSVNETGSTMLLRETSLMPHIPGLPALLSMLFAPVMELRVGRDGKCYTGVLCGLGWNSTTEAPILPEHDIELAFDVCFTVEDIVEVDPKLVMEQADQEGSRGKNTSLYQLHRPVVLSP
ncbi:Putative ATP-dependent RNA helicase TDRD9 [Cricetulus griseus]|uniref:RNA helicase n=1 Tax=Cricetulus griseus TaxID=10029 RepID=G3H388_CRIGR|nr:Putative ATP-dependent RNA helicase TDRD9 [Cricetulus griseus]